MMKKKIDLFKKNYYNNQKKGNQQKRSGLKINLIILKQIKESPKIIHQKMILNKEWYIIPRELEVEEIIY